MIAVNLRFGIIIIDEKFNFEGGKKMKKILVYSLIMTFSFLFLSFEGVQAATANRENLEVELPEVELDSEIAVETALAERRSIREYSEELLTLKEVAQLLWAAQGETEKTRGYRTAPSAGALYPLEVYVVTEGTKEELEAGVYQYSPDEHKLQQVMAEDKREELYQAGLQQSAIREAPINIVLAGIYERSKDRYGQRGERYTHMEVGHAAQNIYLQAVSLDLGTVMIGAFDEAQVQNILDLEAGEKPLGILPVGRKK